ncbi:asparagine synthase B [Longimicrobium terrae]|uniref:asparagine synthase (glutamine-hydrolyzing) n=1 Tax=Longimicrobium terrae TaxID=1639882 RepID=A0A841H5U5_9BACT|nr:asparagine synthase B [Longimicrobium terrae]MBB4638880.1 asparagine synthase (glutamine-hydrolyzing) [Longimicrobium terrae]MBB6073119.1 asparagine synthase (glutamine-hydrolyzing) [Longimicrobium terrae]NNC30194.1 asparagine synthase B [Longimicrobium terrae]
MCSILAILAIRSDPAPLRARAVRLSRLQRHRGPDWSGVYACDRAVLAHERLSIVDVTHGAQPLRNERGTHALAVNGEIYNHRELRESLAAPYPFATESDCEVILALYAERGTEFIDQLEGMFAFVLYDADRDRYVIARDHMGIIPLYSGYDEHGNLHVASEMKALVPVCQTVAEFPPGHLWDSEVGEPRPFYHRAWRDYEAVAGRPAEPAAVRAALEESVRSHLMSDVPYGVLLSGGLDSSIIAATAKRFAARRVEDDGRSEAWWPSLHSFAIGLEGAPDLEHARAVAEHIGTIHHEFHFTVQEGIDALSDVIHHLETYDVTTIRAATPMYLMARRIRAMGIKMVLSGEGADEIFGGYLYFHRAPDARSFHEETVRKLDRLHSYDCLRANKAMAAWGVEARVPFLDKRFLDVAMSIDPAAKMAGPGRMEKHILREAFEDVLPASVAWRQKEQFSDGVGYGWIDALREHAEAQVGAREMENAHFRFPYNTPPTREAYLYRTLFAEHFPLQSCAECVPGGKSVACSTPEALAWDASLLAVVDPSGRALQGVHQAAYGAAAI